MNLKPHFRIRFLTTMKTSKRHFLTNALTGILDSARQRSLILALALGTPIAVSAADIGKTFATPEEAVSALAAAASTQDTNALRVIFGPAVVDLENADRVQATNDFREFTTALNRADAGKFDSFAVGWSGRVDPDGNFYQFVNTKGSQNDSGYSNPVVDRATNNARAAATEKARLASYRAAIKQVLKDLPLIYLYHPVNRFGVVKTVGGVQVYGDGLIGAQFAGFKK